MEYIYSALLLYSAGKEINEANIKKVLDAAGIDADAARIKALTASLDGINIEEAISKSVVAPVTVAPASSEATSAPTDKGKPKEEKKEDKKEKKKEEKVTEEEAAAGLGALFG